MQWCVSMQSLQLDRKQELSNDDHQDARLPCGPSGMCCPAFDCSCPALPCPALKSACPALPCPACNAACSALPLIVHVLPSPALPSPALLCPARLRFVAAVPSDMFCRLSALCISSATLQRNNHLQLFHAQCMMCCASCIYPLPFLVINFTFFSISRAFRVAAAQLQLLNTDTANFNLLFLCLSVVYICIR